MILYMHIAPGQGQTTPRGQNFVFNRNILSLRSFVTSFKNISLKANFINIFNAFIHVYGPRAGAVNPSMSTERPYHFAHLLQVSKDSYEL